MPKSLVTINEIAGALAMWVCRQHPEHSVDGVDAVNHVLRRVTQQLPDWSGPAGLRMKVFDGPDEVERFLWAVIGGLRQVIDWNTRQQPHNDFIDIHALFRNVATTAVMFGLEDLTGHAVSASATAGLSHHLPAGAASPALSSSDQAVLDIALSATAPRGSGM